MSPGAKRAFLNKEGSLLQGKLDVESVSSSKKGFPKQGCLLHGKLDLVLLFNIGIGIGLNLVEEKDMEIKELVDHSNPFHTSFWNSCLP